jgi:2-polyprenyl-6-hydroxyphenyl methylase/3-demethylubiquinone-9 3-methyltransferase
MRPLHELNPLRLDWIDRLASLAGKRVLDVGCGGGVLAESMAARGAQVTGIDLASKLLKVAELHALESGISVDYRLSSAEEFAHAGGEVGRYDVVTCMEMLEHVPDPASVVRACAALARPDGWVFFSTINRNPKAFAFAILGAEYVLGLLPRGTHEYAKFIRPSELAAYARGAGLTLAELTGMTYNPLTRRFALAPDTDVNYLVACRRPAA